MKTRIVINQSFQKLFAFVLLTSILSGAFAVSAQTRRTIKQSSGKTPTISKTADAKTNPKCSGGWSGTITFSKTLDESGSGDGPGIKHVKDRQIHKWSENLNYTGRITVDGNSDPRKPKGFGSVQFSQTRKQQSIAKVWDSCKAVNDQHYMIDDNIREDVETGNGAGETEWFDLDVDELGGTYHFSFRFADVPGSLSSEDHTKRSGHCGGKLNAPSDYSGKRETNITGEGGKVENQKIDPKNPNVLTGSATIDRNDYNDSDNVKQPIEVITWKFRRCSPPLMIADVKFSQPLYPSPNSFVEIGSDDHTIDGNQVKITATVVNLSGERKTANVQFKELIENTLLPESGKPETFEPHEQKEVELIWDTSGYAWKQTAPYNTAINTREIEVSIPDDKMKEEISVYPKPVVVVPGMWSKHEKINQLVGYFKNQNVPWSIALAHVFVGKKAEANAPIVDKAVRNLQAKENAWHVDVVAHSTGGLTARAYINSEMPMQFDNFPTVKHLVMLGSPNLGTPCAAGVDNIITKFFNRNPEIFSEISHKNIVSFNNAVTNTRGTKFLAVATNTISPVCQLEESGDGVVPFVSAIYTSKSYVVTNVPHEDLGGDQTVFTQIKKWLALSPKESKMAINSNLTDFNRLNDNQSAFTEENFGKFRRYGAMFHAVDFAENANVNSASDEPEPNFATGLKLAANETREIEIPVTGGSRLSLILYAPANISASLIDNKGEMVGKNFAGTPEANEIFRTMTVKKPFQNGKWILKLESREQTESEIVVTAYINFNSTAAVAAAE